jgi:3-methyladenine DNA glycosylase/8-oxoguanine DNA glycosylase
MSPLSSTFTMPGPLDTAATFRLHRHGPGDPTIKIGPRELWRATGTPEGAATLHLDIHDREVTARAWGPGAAWVMARAGLIAGLDDVSNLKTEHPRLSELQHQLVGLRIGATHRVMEALVPAILEQKVTSYEAHRSFNQMVYALGEPAPGPMKLRVAPDPSVLASQPYWVFHRFGIERKRADVIRAVSARAERLEECVDLSPEEAMARLRLFAGVGAWTAAEVTARAMGDVDAVSVGDFHLPHLVAWVLAGEMRATDERMLELLEPYRGERGRVIRLIECGAGRRPRRAPRQRIRTIQTI